MHITTVTKKKETNKNQNQKHKPHRMNKLLACVALKKLTVDCEADYLSIVSSPASKTLFKTLEESLAPYIVE